MGLSEPELLQELFKLIEKSSEVKNIDELLVKATEIIKNINSYCWEKLQKNIFFGLESIKFQTKIFCLKIIQNFSNIYPEVTSQYMPELINVLILLTSDPKKEVKIEVEQTFNIIVKTILNVDIIHLFPIVISAYMNPVANTQKALDALVSTPFVNDVDIPTLGFLVPLLIKSMRERKMVYQRRSAVVMDTMCKLLKNPVYAKKFYNVLEPALSKGYDEIAEPEIRQVCKNSLEVLNKVYNLGLNKLLDSYTRELCESQYKQILFNYSVSSDLVNSEIISHSIDLVYNLVRHENILEEIWNQCIKPYLDGIVKSELNQNLDIITNEIRETIIKEVHVEEYNPEDNEDNLCDCQFSLAYGTRVLLHQTPFKVKIGRKYGLVGPNGAGKSTLMKAISNRNLQEFPPELTSIYVEHDIQGSKSDLSVLDYLASDERILSLGKNIDHVKKALEDIGFLEGMINGPVTALSGGWRMKLSLSKAVLVDPDLYLLDEPTNHLDEFAVKWLVDYINKLNKTCLLVSHDTKFLDAVCTNIIHYENLKLKIYRGNLAEFVKQKPEAKQYYELTSDNVAFNFPDPGYLEGVKSLTKAVVKMKDCYFQYPAAPKPQLSNVSIQVSLASKVAIVGVNGAGKSTLVKLLVGEIEPNKGLIERHPNVRVAYVAQHAFHHIESHLDKTPVEYVMWRYSAGYDKEAVENDAVTMTVEEIAAIKLKATENKELIIIELIARRTGKRENEYEAKYEVNKLDMTRWFTKSELLEMGYEKMLKEKDQQIAMESMMGQRKLTTGEIQKHFDNFGLPPDFAQHSKIGMLSGGQKVKVVLGACTFFLPHVIILDEPTNFLDRDSIGALSNAIKNFKGGILLISHNSEFYKAICPESWILEGGYLSVLGGDWAESVEKARKLAEKENAKKLKFDQEEEKFDSLGNKIEVIKEKKEINRNDKKKLLKMKKEMEKKGEDTYEIDQMLGLE
jgi:elongation factor 3